MNRTDLASELHTRLPSLNKRQTMDIVSALFDDIIPSALQADQQVNITGFGKFGTKQRQERTITGGIAKDTVVPAHTAATFKPGVHLKEAINS